MMGSLVSVIIPTKNRPDLLMRAVSSVLQQKYRPLEIIVVDDGSQPPAKFDAPEIRIIRNEQSKGGAAARNQGISAVQGQYFAFLDDDDFYLPNKLADQVGFLEQNRDFDFVFSQTVLADSATNEAKSFLEPSFRYDIRENFKRFNLIHTNSTLFRTQCADRVRFNERLKKFQDMQFHLAASLNLHGAYLPVEVAVWNIDNRPDRITMQGAQVDYECFEIICREFEEYIKQDRATFRRYYAKLGLYAIRAGKWRETFSTIQALNFPDAALVGGLLMLSRFPMLDRLRLRLGLTLNRLGTS
jgi:glycosyltransferase involved in cell wall biosynthesis